MAKTTNKISRGDIYRVSLHQGGQEAEQKVEQKVLVIQNDIGNRYGSSVIVTPLSEDPRAKGLFFTVPIPGFPVTALRGEHVALLFQIRTLSKQLFFPEAYLGSLEVSTMQQVDRALEMSLGLSTLQNLQTRNKFSSRAKSC